MDELTSMEHWWNDNESRGQLLPVSLSITNPHILAWDRTQACTDSKFPPLIRKRGTLNDMQ